MTKIKSITGGLATACATLQYGYLRILFPVSFILSCLAVYCWQTRQSIELLPTLVVMFALWTLVPPILTARAKIRSRDFLAALGLAVADVAIVSLIILLNPLREIEHWLALILPAFLCAGVLLSIIVLQLRLLRALRGMNKSSLLTDIRNVWQSAHSYALLSFLGFLPTFAIFGLISWFQTTIKLPSPMMNFAVGVVTVVVLIVPSLFFPFILVSERLNRTISEEPREQDEDGEVAAATPATPATPAANG